MPGSCSHTGFTNHFNIGGFMEKVRLVPHVCFRTSKALTSNVAVVASAIKIGMPATSDTCTVYAASQYGAL
jgi:hypothetical protein